MALVARIKSVEHTTTATREDGTTYTVDLSLSGELLVVAEYADTAAPTVIIHTHRFQVSATETPLQIRNRVIDFARSVRDARVRTTELKTFIGTVLPIPD